MWARKSRLTILLTANYLLAVTTSGLFHDHGDHDEDQQRPGASASHLGDGHDCPVCQFLAQKPVPVALIAPVDSGRLAQSRPAGAGVRRSFSLYGLAKPRSADSWLNISRFS